MKNHVEIAIIESDLFVSSDMVHTIHAVLPSAECRVFTSISEARGASVQPAAHLLAIVSATSDGDFVVSPDDARWLSERKVVAFDFRDRVARSGWIYLDKPFSEEDLAAAVLALLPSGLSKLNGMTQEAR
ncbi:hypothetical protein CEP88_02230 [Roseobacter denitrificans]|uniref:hypothetical protein n=1 Tax=Roseobacter denitrificans TaxID=2434 RepID=UPI0005C43C98|nr:hypothetical protein [Roseobacter denitrificans]AVL51552.1 hypothetical protein CEP88_02230 [Roseobacter denitrificans]SFG36444.1 hypothetical protein SAMN05443635_11490 [Roseobacter denitrificans OCh 114]